MILFKLQDSERIEPLHPLFKRLFDYVKSHDLLSIETGRIELEGKNLFINNVLIVGVPREKQVLEGHRLYIDVHILLAGEERIGWKALGNVQTFSKIYSEEEDCLLSAEAPTAYVDMEPGDFCIVYPEDMHAPIIGNSEIRKLIAKVKI